MVLCCFVLLSFTGGVKKKHQTGWEKENLKGKVKSYEVDEYNAVNDSGIIMKGDSLISKRYYMFDDKGYEIEAGYYRPEDRWYARTVNTNNSNGYCMQAKSYKYTAIDTTLTTMKFKYDENWNRIEEDLFFDKGKDSARTLYKYDENGNMLSWAYISGKDTLPGGGISKYDEDGNLTESDWYVSGKLQTRTIRTYDGQGKFVGYNVYYPDESIKQKEIGHKDDKGNTIEYDVYNGKDSLVEKHEFNINYDWAGNRLGQIELLNGKPSTFTVYELMYY